MANPRTLPVLLAALITLCGCAPEPPESVVRRLATQYFDANNTAARQGPQAQQDFLHRTQHPDFVDQTCQTGGLTVDLNPAMSTLRRDPSFAPAGAGPPRGEAWVVAVEVTVRRDEVVQGKQIGSQHVVLLDGKVYGFAPCPTTVDK